MGRYAVDALIPFLTIVTDGVDSAYTAVLKYQRAPDGDQLTMTALVTQPIYVHNGLTINPGARMSDAIDDLHVLVPLVILFTTLIAWPANSWRERVLLVAWGVPIAFIVSALTVPFLLSGKLETMLIDSAAQAGIVRAPNLTVYWMLFCESGGRWLIPLVAAFVCAIGTRKRFAQR